MPQPPPGGPVEKTPATLPFQRAELAGLADTQSFAHDTSAPDKQAAAQPAVVGQRFGDYELLEEIARGGMGVVYKARQRGLKRLVALKTIQAGEFANADQILRFQTEAQSVARLNHPGIVPVYEVGIYRGLHFFSMQYLAGGSLADRLMKGPLPARDGAAIVQQVAEAVQAAHEQQIIHRDLKPGNILLDEQGVPRVTDFGLAKQLDSDDGLTQTGDVMGTPSYMAPEQAQGQQDRIGPATDVYALGAILYHVLTGRPPFQGASKIETLRQVVEQEPAALRHLNAAIPRDLETIALKCLRKESGKRYATTAELAADLGRWLEKKPILARPVERSEKVWLWCKRRPTVAAAIALIAVTVIGSGMAISAMRNAAAEQQAETEKKAAIEQAKTEEKAAREQAETVVASHLIAPAAAVPYSLAQLKPLQQYVTPLLRAKLADESAGVVERLHAAYGLTELGDPQQAFLLDAIPTAPAAECSNLVAALQGVKSTALPELSRRSATAIESLVKARYAIVSLQLGDPQPVQECLALRPDPIDRTTLIHAFADWHGDLSEVANLLASAPHPRPLSRGVPGRGESDARAGRGEEGSQASAGRGETDTGEGRGPASPNPLLPAAERGAASTVPPRPGTPGRGAGGEGSGGNDEARNQQSEATAAFRSGLCAALGLIPPDRLAASEREAATRVLLELYTTAPDGGTHSAAGWALRQWGVELPTIAGTANPPAGRGWHVNGQGQTMIAIPAGRFTMGMVKNNFDMRHEVAIARGSWLDDREVTVEQFMRFMDDTEYPAAEKPAGWNEAYEKSKVYSPASDGPVNLVNWFDAVSYCNWLSVQEGLHPAYERTGEKWKWVGYQGKEQEADAWRCDFKSNGYRLPTEAEWEIACRAVTASTYCFGDDEDQISQYGWVVDNSKSHAWPGGLKQPNGWGLFDMHGNLWEWIDDVYSLGEASNNKISRVVRGGAFGGGQASAAASALFTTYIADFRNVYNGFRPARTYP